MRAILILLSMMFQGQQSFGADTVSIASSSSVLAPEDSTLKLFGGKITNNGFGGIAIKINRINGQLAIMTGGRGAIIINDRFTIGGGGYGIANSIRLWSPSADTTRTFKMGYGGLELGYIFYSGEDLYFGGLVLFAAGAVFWESQPPESGKKNIW